MPTHRKQSSLNSLKDIDGLTSKQAAALAALLQGRTISDAAKAAGVNRGTLSNWLYFDPIFTGRLKELRAEVLRQVVISVQAEVLNSIRFLADVRDNAAAPLAQRIRAATSLLTAKGFEDSEYPAGALRSEEAQALGALAIRKNDDVEKDRQAHRREVSDRFSKTKDGRRLLELTRRIPALSHRLRLLDKKCKDYELQFAGMNVREARAHPDHRAHIDAINEQCEVAMQLESVVTEISRLEEAERAYTDKIVNMPDEFAADNARIARLAAKFGKNAVVAVAQELGALEGRSKEIEHILTERAVAAMAKEDALRKAAADKESTTTS